MCSVVSRLKMLIPVNGSPSVEDHLECSFHSFSITDRLLEDVPSIEKNIDGILKLRSIVVVAKFRDHQPLPRRHRQLMPDDRPTKDNAVGNGTTAANSTCMH